MAKKVLVDIEIPSIKKRRRWQAQDETLWATEEEADDHDEQVAEEKANQERLASLCWPIDSSIYTIIGSIEDHNIYDKTYWIIANSQEDIDFLLKNNICLERAYKFNKKFKFGKLYIYQEVQYTDATGGGHTSLYDEEDLNIQIKRYRSESERTIAIALESLEIAKKKLPDENHSTSPEDCDE